MNKRRTKPLIPPTVGLWARVGLCTLLVTATFIATAQTSDDKDGGVQPFQDQNRELLRTRTWSIYAQGGLSWATDVWYQNVDAGRSYQWSPAAGGGVDYTIRPWVRVGAEYLWSRYRREQRYSSLDMETWPVKAYGNYMMNVHNAKVGIGFNALELWPNRRAQWLNIWAGTGVGYTFAQGNEYSIRLDNTETDGPGGSKIVTGSVQATNRHEKFNTFFIPASLHIEADVSRNLSLGLKGEMDWLLNRKDIAPKSYAFALVTLRYHFVPSHTKALKTYYDGALSTLESRLNAQRREAAEANARADRAENARRQAEQQNADLQRRLAECENSEPAAAIVLLPSHFVQFEHDSADMSREEIERLKAFARSVRGRRLSIVAEASTPGTDDYNQSLSERRLSRVVEALIQEGFTNEDLFPTTAIGEQNGKPGFEGRRVTITVEENK